MGNKQNKGRKTWNIYQRKEDFLRYSFDTSNLSKSNQKTPITRYWGPRIKTNLKDRNYSRYIRTEPGSSHKRRGTISLKQTEINKALGMHRGFKDLRPVYDQKKFGRAKDLANHWEF